MSVRIITDSACDLPKEILDTYDIRVLSFVIYIDQQEYLDGIDINSQDVFKAMRAGEVPKTAQVTAKQFKDTFEAYAEAGDPCIYIAFSSKLSGTYQTSKLIAQEVKEKYPNFDITIVDSKGGSLGSGLIVLEAGKMAKEGKTKEEIVKRVQYYSGRIEHIFTVQDLKYLHRGGRLSGASAFIGGLLNIKPILNVKDGIMIPIEKIRGRNRAIKRIVDIIEEQDIDLKNQIIGITHADDPVAAEKLKKMIEEKLGHENFIVNRIGSVLGSHIGLGGVAAFFLNDSPDHQR